MRESSIMMIPIEIVLVIIFIAFGCFVFAWVMNHKVRSNKKEDKILLDNKWSKMVTSQIETLSYLYRLRKELRDSGEVNEALNSDIKLRESVVNNIFIGAPRDLGTSIDMGF